MEDEMKINTTETHVTVNGKTITWQQLRQAAYQSDPELKAVYSEILATARQLEAKRLQGEEWRNLGFPLIAVFDRFYGGQIVMKAGEIRRIGKDRVAYVVTWDRSEPSARAIQRKASPRFATIDECFEWLRSEYPRWHDEVKERDAKAFLVA
jgi:hypothetical protein